MEEPSFKVIADLFAVPNLPEVYEDEEVEAPRKRVGVNSVESGELGRQSLNDGDYEAAIKHFKKAVEQSRTGDTTALIDLGGAYAYGDEAPAAYRQFQRALKLQSGQAEPHAGMGEVLRRYGRFKDAISELEAAIQTDPSNAFYHFKLADTLKEAGEPTKASLAILGAITIQPDYHFFHFWLGDLLLSMKRYDDALESLRAAIEMSPGDDFYYMRAAVAFWGAGRKPEAIKAVRLASDLDPSKRFYRGLIAEFLRQNDQAEDAKQEEIHEQKLDAYDRDHLRRVFEELGISEPA